MRSLFCNLCKAHFLDFLFFKFHTTPTNGRQGVNYFSTWHGIGDPYYRGDPRISDQKSCWRETKYPPS